MASLKLYYCQLKQSYKAAKTKSRSGTSDVKKPVWSSPLKFHHLKVYQKNEARKDCKNQVYYHKKKLGFLIKISESLNFCNLAMNQRKVKARMI